MTKLAPPRALMLCAAAIALAGCEGPDAAGPAAPSGDEQAALEKAEAMIEDNRTRLTQDDAEDDKGNEE